MCSVTGRKPRAQLLTQSVGRLPLDTQRVGSDLRLRDGLTQPFVDDVLAPCGDAAGAAVISVRLRDGLALGAPGALLLPGAPDLPWLLQCPQQAQRDVRRTHSAVAALLARLRSQANARAGAGAEDAALLATLETTVAEPFAAGPGRRLSVAALAVDFGRDC